MLRDDRGNGGGRRLAPRNVFGEPLETCSIKPMLGFYRDGCCNTGREDIGSHTVCAVMTSEFLDFSKSRGNDLSDMRPPGARAAPRGRPWHAVQRRYGDELQHPAQLGKLSSGGLSCRSWERWCPLCRSCPSSSSPSRCFPPRTVDPCRWGRDSRCTSVGRTDDRPIA